MGLLGKLGLDEVIGEVGKTVRQVLPNKEAERAFDLAMAQLKDQLEARVHQELMAQIEVNKTEAAHTNIFVAGWRPFIGWVCGVGMAWNFVLAPLLSAFGLRDLLMLNIEYLITMVVTMLGSSGIRTFEKLKGVNDGEPSHMVRPPVNLLPAQYVEEPADVPAEEENAPWNKG